MRGGGCPSLKRTLIARKRYCGTTAGSDLIGNGGRRRILPRVLPSLHAGHRGAPVSGVYPDTKEGGDRLCVSLVLGRCRCPLWTTSGFGLASGSMFAHTVGLGLSGEARRLR